MKKSDTERIKLLATAFNNLGVAALTIGVVTPGVAYLYGVGTAPDLRRLLAFSALFLSFALLLHLFGAFILKDLDQ